MITFTVGTVAGIAVSLVVNYMFPTLFAKWTRKAGKVVDKI